ncbi:MAG TPA: HAD family phosphatase [Solirubrobacteraceae bacterium]|jgi:epoxide hydrolase-like predicted phosphatase
MKGLLVDFGGVLTTDVFESFAAFCRAEGLDPSFVRDRFMHDATARDLLHELELGRISEPEFERRFAELLGVAPDGLVDRLFGGMAPEPAVIQAVRAARAAGVRTGLLSNSWGDHRYDREQFPALFDVTVISGEVGLRKPDPAIYELAAERLGLPAAQIVFVDDLPGNLKPARALGMTTVLHRSAPETVAELERVLGVALAT